METMRERCTPVLAAVLVLTLALCPTGYGQEPASLRKTALDEYIAKPDPSYSWKVVNTIPGDAYTTFVVDMQSQTWRAAPEVDRAVWQHWLVIVKPNTVKQDTAFLTIGGGKNGGPAPAGPSPQTITFAKATNTVVAELRMIPNQPLIFN